MSSFVYTPAKTKLAKALADLQESGLDVRVMLVMTDTTCGSEEDASSLAAFTDYDEFDGANYVRKALASQAVTEDTANDRAEFSATDVTWSGLGAGTRSIQAAVLYVYVDGTDANDWPLAYLDSAKIPELPMNGNGSDVTLTWDSEGILQVT